MTTSNLENLIRFENANSGLAFRERGYSEFERADLLREILALANAHVEGPRFLALGVRDVVGGERVLLGMSAAALRETRAALPRLVDLTIEPSLKVTLKDLVIDGATVAVACFAGCEDPPYLLKHKLSKSLHAGRGWVRLGTKRLPLLRSDLQRMFRAKFAAAIPGVNLLVGFPGKTPQDEITLPALPLDQLPSELAAQRLKKVLEAKKTAKDVFGKTDTRIDRLLHAQIVGNDEVYESHSDDSLTKELHATPDDYAAADARYSFEVRAHRLNIVISNIGDTPIDNAMLTLRIPRVEGIGVAEQPCLEDDIRLEAYPLVDNGARTIIIRAEIGAIPKHTTVAAFPEPPRLWIREPAAGNTIALDYMLHCRQLAEPLTDMLRLRMVGPTAR